MQLQKLLGPSSARALFLSEVVLLISCYVVAVGVIVPFDPVAFLLHHGGLIRIFIVVAALVAAFYFQDLYEDLRVTSTTLLLRQVCLAGGLAFIVQALLNYGDSSLVFPRWVMLLGSGIALVVVPCWRILFSNAVTAAQHGERILFLGCDKLVRELDKRFRERPELGRRGIGYIADECHSGLSGKLKHLGKLAGFREIVDDCRPDRIIVGMEERRNTLPLYDLLDLRFSGIEIEEAATAYEAAFDRVCLEQLRPSQLIFSSQLGPSRQTLEIQGLYSGAAATLLLVLSLPLMLVTAILVKLTSKGPIVYKQKRVGQNGKVFTVYKFRSMRVDAETRGAVWAAENDPRVTPIGRFLRRSRIDELPQLLNVLRGEMAVVGPRPERPEFVEELAAQIPFYRQRLAVRPGITGWAQINHEYSSSIEDTIRKLEYDLYYIKHLTATLDAYVMFHTFKVILLGRGAR